VEGKIMGPEGTKRRSEQVTLAASELKELAFKIESGRVKTDEEIATELRRLIDTTLSPWACLDEFKNPERKFVGREN
jgi:hypothetical protein